MTKYDVYMKRPASVFGEKWRDGTPLGNGLTGINLYGGVSRETFIISRYDMWSTVGSGISDTPDVSDCIGKMRELAKQGKYEEASVVMYNRFKELGYGPMGQHMRCLCQAVFYFECGGVYSDYTRCLHMDKAEADITYSIDDKCYRRRTFVSRENDIAVSEFMFGEPTSFKAEAGYFDSREEGREDHIKNIHLKNERWGDRDGFYAYSSMNDDNTYCGMVMKIASNGEITSSEKYIDVKNASFAVVYIKAFSGEKDLETAITNAIQTIKSNVSSYDDMLLKHKALHKKYFLSSELSLNPSARLHSNEELLAMAREKECPLELLEKLWYFGRYLFISGTNVNGHPFPLYGLWVSGYDRSWSQHVANENVEMIYWHTVVGGLSELVKPLIEYYYGKMDKFRMAAKNVYGCKGIYVSVYTTPGQSTPIGVPVLAHFTGTGGWLSRHFYDYYLMTGDEELFEGKILPFMLEVAEFYEDYLYDGNDGMLEFYPSVSPENTPREYKNTDFGLGHPMPVYKNATIEFAILKELLTNLVTISETHPELSEKAGKWRAMLDKIPEYMINEDGAIAEWMDKDVHDWYFHRHLSHVYPLFPGTEIEDEDKNELLPAFEKAVDMRVLGSYTGWSLTHMSAIYARLSNSEKAYKMINMLTKVCLLDNFFTMHNDFRSMGITTDTMGSDSFAPVQLDAAMGTVNAIQEWLIRITKNRVYLLPACPKDINRGIVKNFRIFGGKITFEWDLSKKLITGEITAERDFETELILPFGKGKKKLRLNKGDKKNI